VLLEAVVTDSPGIVDAAVAVCEARANDDDDLGSLAASCRAFSTLITFGSSRSTALLEDTVVTLCQRTYTRALLRAPAACRCSDEGVAAVQRALRNLHETAQGQEHLDSAAWFSAAQQIAVDDDVHAACAGRPRACWPSRASCMITRSSICSASSSPPSTNRRRARSSSRDFSPSTR